MSWTLDISRRLRLTGDRGGSSRAGVAIAVAGVALALAVMEITLAVVCGFKEEIRKKLMGFDSQITILPPYDYASATSSDTIVLTPQLIDAVSRALPDATASLTIRQPGMLKTPDDFSGVYFIGRDGRNGFEFERSSVVRGEWPDDSSGDDSNVIVISESTSRTLGIDTMDRVYAYFFDGDAVKMRRYTVGAVYSTNFGEYDTNVVYASLHELQSVCGYGSATGTEVELTGLRPDGGYVHNAATHLQECLLNDYYARTLVDAYPISDVTESGAQYFSWLSLLDTNVIVIFALMLCVAGFTLISSLFILALERVSTIGILRSLGASKADIARIFTDMAMRIVGIGIIIGNIIGLGLLFLQKTVVLIRLNPEMYYLDKAPVSIHPWQFIAVNVGMAVVAWLILLIPAQAASRISPAETMRYE